MSRIRVVLADDHPVVRDGIRAMLEREPDITVVGEAANGAEALRLAQEMEPDVLLLDMEMPGFSGVKVAKKLQEMNSPVRILGLSAYDDRQYVLNLLANGATGYLTKDEAPHAIVEAVRGVSRGQRGWLSQQAAARVVKWVQDREAEPLELSGRETEVLRLVVAGKTNQAISLELGISEKTVERHLQVLYSKLGVASRVEAAVRAVREALV